MPMMPNLDPAMEDERPTVEPRPPLSEREIIAILDSYSGRRYLPARLSLARSARGRSNTTTWSRMGRRERRTVAAKGITRREPRAPGGLGCPVAHPEGRGAIDKVRLSQMQRLGVNAQLISRGASWILQAR
jgi:hypothetical protein